MVALQSLASALIESFHIIPPVPPFPRLEVDQSTQGPLLEFEARHFFEGAPSVLPTVRRCSQHPVVCDPFFAELPLSHLTPGSHNPLTIPDRILRVIDPDSVKKAQFIPCPSYGAAGGSNSEKISWREPGQAEVIA